MHSATASPSPHTSDLQISNLKIPQELGYVVSTSTASGTSPSSIIVHIQEAHTNYESQQHLASLLEQLIQQYGLKLILVEGGHGDDSLSYLRSYGPPDNRKQIAEKYLKLGWISGEEYLDIAKDYPLTLWGVEQQDLYQRNLDAFLAVEPLQAFLKPAIASIRSILTTLAAKDSDPAWNELEAKTQAFSKEQLGLADYAAFLQRAAASHHLSMDAFPNLSRLLSVHELERTIHLDAVQQEQQALIKRISQAATPQQLDELRTKSRQAQTGTLTSEAFYADLGQLAAASHVSLDAFPALSRYIQSMTLSAEIQLPALPKELDALVARVRGQLATTPQRQQRQALAEQVDLVDKMVNLQLNSAEYERLQSLKLDHLADRWGKILNAQLAAAGLPTQSVPGLNELEAALPAFQQFYEVARRRDQALAENTLAKLQETKERLAVLITGGFHSQLITEQLTKHGVGIVSVALRISQPTDERLYRAVLKYKGGHGSLDEVMRIANHETAAGVK